MSKQHADLIARAGSQYTVPSVTSRLPDKGVLIINKDDHGSLSTNHVGTRKHL